MSTTLIEIRRARSADATNVAGTHDEAWRAAYQGIIPGNELDKLINRRGPEWWDSAIRKGSRITILQFGDKVAGIVMEVTDDKTLPKAERKRRQVSSAGHKSREARIVKLADKTSNLRTISVSPAPDWSTQRRLDYVQWAREVIAQVRGVSPWLEAQFDAAAEQAIASVEPITA